MNWIKPSADYHYLHVGEWFAEIKKFDWGWYGRAARLLPGKTPDYVWKEIGGEGYVRYYVTGHSNTTKNAKRIVRNAMELFVDKQLKIDSNMFIEIDMEQLMKDFAEECINPQPGKLIRIKREVKK